MMNMKKPTLWAMMLLGLLAVALAATEIDAKFDAAPAMDDAENVMSSPAEDIADFNDSEDIANDSEDVAMPANDSEDVAEIANDSEDVAEIANDSEDIADFAAFNDSEEVMSSPDAEIANETEDIADAPDADVQGDEVADADADAFGRFNSFCYNYIYRRHGNRVWWRRHCVNKPGCKITAYTGRATRHSYYFQLNARLHRCNMFRPIMSSGYYNRCVHYARRGYIMGMHFRYQCKGRRYCANHLQVIDGGRACLTVAHLMHMCRWRALRGHALARCYMYARKGRHPRIYNRRICRNYTRTTRICQYSVNARLRSWQRGCRDAHSITMRRHQCSNIYHTLYRNAAVHKQCMRHAPNYILAYRMNYHCFNLTVAAAKKTVKKTVKRPVNRGRCTTVACRVAYLYHKAKRIFK